MNSKTIKMISLLAVTAGTLAGCTRISGMLKPDDDQRQIEFVAAPAPAPNKPDSPAPPPPTMQAAADSFFADHKARHPGDVVTVLIVESSEISQSARTKADKTQSLTGSLLQKDAEIQRWDANMNTGFDGGGSIERSGRVLGKLAVIVQEVGVSGNLHIKGIQDIVVNSERQRMRLEGVIRPEDIGPDNTVLSWRVTDARIDLTGRGFLSRKQSPGLVSWLLALFGV